MALTVPEHLQQEVPFAERSPLLRIRGLSVRYGGLKAVDEVDLDVPAGTVVGLIGPNGAGKTSFIDGVSGFVAAKGTVSLGGQSLQKAAPHRRVHAGLARTFQTSDALHDLTAEDLIRVNSREVVRRRRNGVWRRRAHGADAESSLLGDVLELLNEIGAFGDKPISDLPTGISRLVGVAAAVATRPKVLMLDEPAAGVSSDSAEELTRAIHLLRDDGLGVLVVDHNVGFVTRTCDHVYAMHFGKLIFSGTPEEMHKSEEVHNVYLGEVPGI